MKNQDYIIIEEVPVEKAVEIIEIEKFNPYHDSRGRFAASGGGKFYATPGKSKAHDLAIAREKERQASSGKASAESGGKYAGRFADGTEEQLRRAERNLTNGIERTKNAIASNKYMVGQSKKEHLAHHTNTLKELEAQQAELKREMTKRGMKPNK